MSCWIYSPCAFLVVVAAELLLSGALKGGFVRFAYSAGFVEVN